MIGILKFLFSFDGRLSRRLYAVVAPAVLLALYLPGLAALHMRGSDGSLIDVLRRPFGPLLGPYFFSGDARVPDVAFFGQLSWVLLCAWVLTALSLRRSRQANLPGIVAAFAAVPLVQLGVVVILAVAPRQEAQPSYSADFEDSRSNWTPAIQGVLIGGILTPFAVMLGALVFHDYGISMFVGLPFLVGLASGFLANRAGDIGGGRTIRIVSEAMVIGAALLMALALEGLVCIVVAFPLAWPVAIVGGLLGRALAKTGRPSRLNAFIGFVALPLMFAGEVPLSTTFKVESAIDIDAAPETVWHAVVHMESITTPPALPFRLGIAYPIRGETLGEGVGAERHGVFSTGVALERVTVWQPNQELAIEVIRDAPSLHELSPYETVHAPHVVGYFQTKGGSFRFIVLPDGRTRLVERTVHMLKLEPVAYWLPMARWIVRENHHRVLTQFKAVAERGRG